MTTTVPTQPNSVGSSDPVTDRADPVSDDTGSGSVLDQPLPPIKARRRLGKLTFALGFAFMAAAGFFTGAALQHKHDADNPPTADNPFAGLAAARASGGSTGGGGGSGRGGASRGATDSSGSGAGSSGGTAGTVKLVDGDKIYVQLSDGSVVKYLVQPETQIGRMAPGTLAQVTVGQSLTVTGSQASDDATVAQVILLGGPANPASPAASSPSGSGT